MKNTHISTYGKNGIRFDALTLAALIFVQSTLPGFVFGGTPVSIPVIKSSEAIPPRVPGNIQPLVQPETRIQPTPVETRKAEQVQLPGGPDQPEVQSFTPIGSDNLVDPFTGDFSYNIPLMDVDGYPINLAYSAGVGMDQEASWVGLGWNLNPGVINRNMRGIPDDFNGIDAITQDFNQKPNWTVGTSVGMNYEIFSLTIPEDDPGAGDTIGGMSISAKLGVQYNNYMGYGADVSVGSSFSIAKKVGFEVGMQYTGSSQGGASVSANAGLSAEVNKGGNLRTKLSVGSSFNSRQGLQQASINLSAERKFKEKIKEKKEGGLNRIAGYENVGGYLGSTFNFGMSSFVPSIPFDTKANSFTARFKLGVDVVGNDPSFTFDGFFSKSSLTTNTKTVSAVGYSNLQTAQNYDYAMLDFNRENDGSFTKNTPALPIPHLMYDIYSVSGQGVSGSYRMDRQDIGYVFDPYITSSSNSFTLGGEVGVGATFKAGIDVGGAFTHGSSGAWREGNDAAGKIRFYSRTNYFRDADELAYDESDAEFQSIGGSRAAYFPVVNSKKLSGSLKTMAGDHFSIHNSKSLKFRRNQPLTSLTIQEVRNGFGPTKIPASAYGNTQNGILHHTGAFTVTKMDGSRYYYGLPAYSKMQKNVSFAVGDGKTAGLTPDWNTRLVAYSPQDASKVNNRGLDNHFNAQTIPGYAHSYLLTAVLSSDYVDSDAVPGPSKGDLGTYVEFKYKQVADYKWRNPVNASKAFHDRALNADPTDDKANYIYGEKELWYLDTIKTKNHLLIFYTSGRRDAVSVNGESGGLTASNAKMLQLDSLKLYSRPDFESFGANAKAIKVVHFEYDYHLCRNYPGNIDTESSDPLKSGKLTLTKVYFTYEQSYRGEKAPYQFDYDYNPEYNANNVDRWGTYKPNPTGLLGHEDSDPLTNAEFPYCGFDKAGSDQWAAAWNLNRIHLPSGGVMEIFYEADDYAYVQHKRASQMFKIVGIEGCNESCSISDDSNENKKLYFEMIPGTSISDYAAVNQVIYFKALLSMDKNKEHFDYVPGYAVIDEIGTDGPNGWVKLRPGKLRDNGTTSYNPIAISGVQFAVLPHFWWLIKDVYIPTDKKLTRKPKLRIFLKR